MIGRAERPKTWAASLMPVRFALVARPLAVSLAAVCMMSACASDDTPVVPQDITPVRSARSLDAAVAGPNAAAVRKVLFIAVDGLRADKIDNTDGSLLTTPNFERLQRDGIFVRESHQERVRPFGGYRTCPGFIQMMTGKRIAAHGVRGNSDCDDGRFRDYPVFFRRLEQMRPSIRSAAAETAKEVATIIEESCGGGTQAPSCVDLQRFEPTLAGDRSARDQVLQWLASGNFDVIWFHALEVDSVGHESGWDGDSIDRTVETLDAQLIGPLLDAVDAREAATRERWMVIVAADHGGHNRRWPWASLFGKGTHTTRDADKKVPIIVSGTLIPDDGDQGVNAFNTWDLPATIYDYLGLAPDPAWPKTDGTSILNF